ncbi:hypothetical protein LJR090_002628 [Bosea sp. LjRoot90]|uniref:hypothetical protein n=1 Tax=Bosea sp. LjRoot90 TaxID=3342342 RepID=UPI003ECD6645
MISSYILLPDEIMLRHTHAERLAEPRLPAQGSTGKLGPSLRSTVTSGRLRLGISIINDRSPIYDNLQRPGFDRDWL